MYAWDTEEDFYEDYIDEESMAKMIQLDKDDSKVVEWIEGT